VISYQHIKNAQQEYQSVLYEVKDKIARITLDRPEQRNQKSKNTHG